MATHYLEFEKPITELEAKIAELSHLAPTSGSFETEIAALRKKADALRVKTYANLDPWMRTQVARHPQRPHLVDYLDSLFTDFVELHGDRQFGDDQAILGGRPASAASRSWSWATKRVTTPKPASPTTSAWPAPRAIARRSA